MPDVDFVVVGVVVDAVVVVAVVGRGMRTWSCVMTTRCPLKRGQEVTGWGRV